MPNGSIPFAYLLPLPSTKLKMEGALNAINSFFSGSVVNPKVYLQGSVANKVCMYVYMYICVYPCICGWMDVTALVQWDFRCPHHWLRDGQSSCEFSLAPGVC